MKNLVLVTLLTAVTVGAAFEWHHSAQRDSLFVHSVYFWLKDDVTSEQHNEFVEVLRGLENIKSVEAIEVGEPAGTPRDIVDNSYDVALLVYFKDRAGHDLYQVDTIHTQAITVFEDWIKEIVIYDAICYR